MPLTLVRCDITKMKVDAIVNAANESLLGGGGVDGAIHLAAGPELLEECRALGGCSVGEAKRTGAYRLPAKYVIHTVGPVYENGTKNEATLLASCYRKSLTLALEANCDSVAFPLISAGAYGYPKDQALRVATEAIRDFLEEHELTVFLVLFDKASVAAGKERFADLAEYIDDRYAERHAIRRTAGLGREDLDAAPPMPTASFTKRASAPSLQYEADEDCYKAKIPNPELQKKLAELDESFSQMLLRKIDEKGMTDAACYKKANVDRKLFSKIRSNLHYRPTKATALAFAIALELDKEQTEELLRKAGFALSHSNPFDIIIEYHIQQGIYDVYRINEALFFFDQKLLGGGA